MKQITDEVIVAYEELSKVDIDKNIEDMLLSGWSNVQPAPAYWITLFEYVLDVPVTFMSDYTRENFYRVWNSVSEDVKKAMEEIKRVDAND
jgi:hypothetical protein